MTDYNHSSRRRRRWVPNWDNWAGDVSIWPIQRSLHINRGIMIISIIIITTRILIIIVLEMQTEIENPTHMLLL